jgi:hypothetical protein
MAPPSAPPSAPLSAPLSALPAPLHALEAGLLAVRAAVSAAACAAVLSAVLSAVCAAVCVAVCAAALAIPTPARAADPQAPNDGAQVLQSFEHPAAAAPASEGGDLTRRWVMFGLGAPLLILVLVTAGLGVAMGVYGKPVYLAHMICAGLSVTLAIVHAIVGMVWFLPF